MRCRRSRDANVKQDYAGRQADLDETACGSSAAHADTPPPTAGKVRLGVITRAGDETLRSVLVVGATSVIQHALRSGKASPWLAALLKRKSPKLAAVALANKTARIAWKMMVTGEAYSAKSAVAA